MINILYLLAAATTLDKNDLNIPKVEATNGTVTSLFNGVLMVAGIVAIIFIVLGGIKYSTSQGDSNSTAQAKEMIIYALVGIVIVMMSFAILQLVVGRVFG